MLLGFKHSHAQSRQVYGSSRLPLSAGVTICQHAFLYSAPRLSQRAAVGCHSSRGTLWWQAFQLPNPGRHAPCGTSLSAYHGGVPAGVCSCCVAGSRLEAPTAECEGESGAGKPWLCITKCCVQGDIKKDGDKWNSQMTSLVGILFPSSFMALFIWKFLSCNVEA